MKFLGALLSMLVSATLLGAAADSPSLLFPQIAGYGGIAATPDAAEPPRAEARIVFDIVAEAKPAEVNKGLESVARYLNLNAHAGLKPTDVKLALVLHGAATKSALRDDAYGRVTSVATNPNLPLIAALRRHGVEVFVCGQALARQKMARTDVASDVTVAVSAMTVNANKQRDGYAYIAIH